MKKKYHDLFSFKWKLIAKRLIFFVAIGAFIYGTYLPLYAFSPGKSSTQLFNNRALLVLRDSFQVIGEHDFANPKSHLTIFNKTMKTLTIELTGKNGTYPLMLSPKTERSWRIFPGNYHFEASIAGFPTVAGEIPLFAQTQYAWLIWRGEPEISPKIPDLVISDQLPVKNIEKKRKSETVEDDEPLITNH
jgi:hypothetical protein